MSRIMFGHTDGVSIVDADTVEQIRIDWLYDASLRELESLAAQAARPAARTAPLVAPPVAVYTRNA